MVRLEKVNAKNVWAILKLHVAKDQEDFVAPNDFSIIEAYIAVSGNGHASFFDLRCLIHGTITVSGHLSGMTSAPERLFGTDKKIIKDGGGKGMSINLEYYRLFYYVGKYASFSVAAEKLNMNQPNVSRAIKNMEKELDCVLFQRSNKGAILTEKGNAFYQEIKPAIEMIENAEAGLGNRSEQEQGKINIGLSEISIREHFMPIMQRYHELHPNIKLSLTMFYSNSMAVNALKNGNVDFILISSEAKNLPANIRQFRLTESKFWAVCGSSFPDLLNHPVSLQEFSQYPMISLKQGTDYYATMEDYFAANGLKFEPDIEIASFDQSNTMILSNFGVAIIPEDFATVGERVSQSYHTVELLEKIPSSYVSYLVRNDIKQPTYFKDINYMIMHYSEYSNSHQRWNQTLTGQKIP